MEHYLGLFDSFVVGSLLRRAVLCNVYRLDGSALAPGVLIDHKRIGHLRIPAARRHGDSAECGTRASSLGNSGVGCREHYPSVSLAASFKVVLCQLGEGLDPRAIPGRGSLALTPGHA